jgi:hypothetical protein
MCVYPKRLYEFTNLYRAFDRKVWLTLKKKISRNEGWLFVPAFIFESLALGIKFTEVPIIYFDRFGGRSKMRTLSYTKNLLIYAAQFKIRNSRLWTIF